MSHHRTTIVVSIGMLRPEGLDPQHGVGASSSHQHQSKRSNECHELRLYEPDRGC